VHAMSVTDRSGVDAGGAGNQAAADGAGNHPPIDAFPSMIEGRDGWLYLGADVSGACVPSRSLTDTMVSLRGLRAAVQASGRQSVLIVAPDKTTMVPEQLPADYLGKGCAAQARAEFWRRVVGEAGAIDLRPALVDIARRKGSPVYYPRRHALEPRRRTGDDLRTGGPGATRYHPEPGKWPRAAGSRGPTTSVR
jgi:alginate O-acetyltransferase complex protein AlgJ